jgi:oligoendopeptidase F
MSDGFEQYRGRLGESGETLLEAFRFGEEFGLLVSDLFVYAGMRMHEDQRVDKYSGMFARALNVANRSSEANAFFEPELLAIDEGRLWAMVDETEGLEVYRFYLEQQLRGKPYTLDEAGERLMALAWDAIGSPGGGGGGFTDVFEALTNADMDQGSFVDKDGNEVEMSYGRYTRFLESEDREIRERAWKAYYEAFDMYGNTLAANLKGHIKGHIFNAKARGFDSALEAALFGSAIPTDVYRNLVKTVRENVGALHRYVALRKTLLGVDTLRVWDMSAPLVTPAWQDVPYAEAKEIVTDGLSVLGSEYMVPFRKGLEDRWVDVYETQGKRSGAYSWGTYRSKPYMLMNYNGTLDNVFTLAHEYGHSVHSWFANSTQPPAYADYATFVAEVASVTNEALLLGKMLGEAQTQDEKLALLNHSLSQFNNTFFVQVMFADVELQMHEAAERGEALTSESLDKIYYDTYTHYFGPDVVADPLIGLTWSRIPHFYRNFYVFQYATSFAAAQALAETILEGGQPAADQYVALLKAGGSNYPIELLKEAGVDMTSPEPIVATIRAFEGVVSQMEEALREAGKLSEAMGG